MGYPPPPPPPPGAPGGPQPTPGGGYSPPPPGYQPAPPPGGGYPPAGPPPGGPPPGYAPGGPPSGASGGGGNKPLILLMGALVVVVLLVVVGVLVLSLTGGDDTVELSKAQHEEALLTEGDVGNGFTVTPPDDSSDDNPPDATGECRDLLDELDAAGENPFSSADDDDDNASRSFGRDDAATVDHTVGTDDGVVDRFRDLVRACDEIGFASDQGTATIGFAEGDPVPGVDGAYVVDMDFRFEAADGSGTATYGGQLAVWAVKGNASLVVVTDGLELSDDGASATAVPFDPALFEDLVTTADDKLRQVIDDA